ncbi:MAG: metallophosphoesterase [Syntrophobacteria bacterium]
MVVVYAADLHGIRDLYGELFDLAGQMRAQAVIVGGDILPIHGPFQYSIQEQEDFIFEFLAPSLESFLSRSPGVTFYTMLGNDDWQASLTHLRILAEKGLLRQLHAERHILTDGYDVIGYAHVPPTPFTIKDGERRDRRKEMSQAQRCTACRSQGGRIVAVDPYQHFAGLKSIEEELEQLPAPQNPRKGVYVMHSPPSRTKLDRMADGRWIGSRAIREFIERHQPYLTLHGHIHESPEVSGAYLDRIGSTVCINPGQSREELYAVVFQLENVAGTVEHTVFGRAAGQGAGSSVT